MTRFEQELNGNLGDFWKREAEKELEGIRKDLEAGRITIDENGVARNCIGRVLMSDMLEKLAKVTDKVNIEVTTAVREDEVSKSIREYKEARSKNGYSKEEKMEMRAAFGDEEVIDIFTGARIAF